MFGLDCPICGDFARDPMSSGLARAYGEEALSKARFAALNGYVLFVPVAPLVPGYLLLAPAEHRPDVILATGGAQDAAVLAVLRAMVDLFGHAWAFEHTGGGVDGPSCVEHGHVHLLPHHPPPELLRCDQSPLGTADVVVRTLNGSVGLRVSSRRKQHVRRLIADTCELGPTWDWRVFRHGEIYGETCRILDEILKTLRAKEGGGDWTLA